MLKYYVVFLMVMILAGCKNQPSSNTEMPDLEKIISNKESELGYNLKKEFNNDSTYIILSPASGKQARTTGDEINNFIIVRLNDNAIVFDEKIKGGMINWVSLKEVEIYYPAGIPGKEKNSFFNVVTGKKSSKLE